MAALLIWSLLINRCYMLLPSHLCFKGCLYKLYKVACIYWHAVYTYTCTCDKGIEHANGPRHCKTAQTFQPQRPSTSKNVNERKKPCIEYLWVIRCRSLLLIFAVGGFLDVSGMFLGRFCHPPSCRPWQRLWAYQGPLPISQPFTWRTQGYKGAGLGCGEVWEEMKDMKMGRNGKDTDMGG